MPTYEYACPTCGIVEVFQSIKEDALKKCPQCKKAKVQRMVSVGAGVIFKGTGFWETDYNRSADYNKKKSKEDAGSPADPIPQPKTETKTDTKTKTKTDTKSESPSTSTAPAAPTPPAPP